MYTTIIFLAVLSLLVIVHELGHFLTARKFGIRSEEFGLGFPPRLFGVYKNRQGKWKIVRGSKEVTDYDGTIYSLNLIPLGGFVKIKGENGDSDEKDSFASKKPWQRAIVLSAGVTMNIILAVVLFSLGYMVGIPRSLEGLDKGATVLSQKIQVMEVKKDSPAEKAGIIQSDVLLSINNQPFKTFVEVQNFTDTNRDQELNYEILRGKEVKNFNIKPEVLSDTGKGAIGVALVEVGVVRYPWYLAPWQGLKQTYFVTTAIIVAFYDLFKGLILGQGVSADVAGPVKIAQLTGDVARMGFVYLINFASILSINLAIINFLPIPALDGGRVLFLIIEKIKRKPMRKEVEAMIHNISFILLMAMVLIITVKEVLGLFK